MKKLLITLILLGAIYGGSRADNVMTLSEAQGRPADTLTFSLSLSNSDSPVALQAMVPLYGQFGYVEGSCTLSSRANGHALTAMVLDDTLRIYSYSLSLLPYNGNSGEILSFKLIARQEPATYTMPLCNAILSDASGNALPLQTTAGTATILAPKVSVSTSAINYGHIPILSTYTRTVTVSNIGNQPLAINGINTGDATLTHTPATANIEAGSTHTFTITYNPLYAGAIERRAIVNTNAKVGDSIIMITADPFAVNELRPLNATGYTDSIVRIQLRMNNMDSIVGLQTSIKLPSSLIYVPGSFAVDSSRSQNHIATAGLQGDTLTMMIVSTENKSLRGGDGVVAYFDVQLHGYGSFTLNLRNTVLADTAERNGLSAVYTGRVSIQSPRIVCNASLDMGSSAVTGLPTSQYVVSNTGNAPLIIDRVLFMDPHFELVDSLPIVISNNYSRSINIRYTGTVEGNYSTTMQIYSNDPNNELKNVTLSCHRYEPNSLYMQADSVPTFGDATVEFVLDNYSDITAVQMDFTYPHRHYVVNASDFALTNRASGHTASVARLNDSTFRVLFLSLQNSTFVGNDGIVGYVTLHPTDPNGVGSYTANISNVLVADQDGTNKLTTLDSIVHWNTFVQSFTISGNTNNDRCSIAGLGTYNSGSTVTLTANAGANCRFLHWENGDTATTRTIAVISDTMVYAYFMQTDSIMFNDVFCQGTVYNYGGTTINTAGTYYRQSGTEYFDTVYTLSLSMIAKVYDTIERVIGDNDTYTFNGTVLSQTGYYNDTLVASLTGCDSIVTLHLMVLPVITNYIYDTICQGNTYNQYGFSVSEAGLYGDTLQTSLGIDSIVFLSLAVMPNYTIAIHDTICAGNSYTFGGNTYTQSGTYADTLASIFGCDSIVVLNLVVNSGTGSFDNIVACDSYTWIDGVTYTESTNTPIYTIPSTGGCDSVVTLNLTINHSTTGTAIVTACGSYTWIDGITYTQSTNTPTYTLTAANGCDSVVTLNLTINQPTTGSDVQVVCDSFTWIDGVTYTESTNTPTYILTAVNGCDSVVTLNLTVNHSIAVTDTVVACGSYTWIDGNTYTQSINTPTYTFTSVSGCDSVVTLNLTINPNATGIDTQVSCDSYTWIDGVTYTESTNTPTYTLTAANGCDSVVTLNLTINLSVHDTIVDTAINEYTWNGATYTESGVYMYEGVTTAGCDSIVTLMLTIQAIGIEGVDILSELTFYPNPTSGTITFNRTDINKVEVLDAVGRTVAVYENAHIIDISKLTKGYYTMRITTVEGVAVRKVVRN